MDIINKLIQEDKQFSEAEFKSKVDNIYIHLYTSVMRQDLEKIKHFLSNEVIEKYTNKIEKLKNKNQIQMYDELNVSDTDITNICEYEDRFEIEVSLLTKYYDYIIDKTTKKYISGNTNYRVEKRIKLIFSKIKNAKSLGQARTCNSCGANMDLNKNGKCKYCGTIYELEQYEFRYSLQRTEFIGLLLFY